MRQPHRRVFCPAHYQPDGDPVGNVLETIDPGTDARVTVTSKGHLRFSHRIEMKNVGVLEGAETTTETTLGLRGLGKPAPTTFKFEAEQGDYRAERIGLITSELGPGIGRWKIRGYGSLDLSDSVGKRGKRTLDRSGSLVVSLSTNNRHSIQVKERLV